MKLLSALFLVAVLLNAPWCRADILFIDTNNAPEEIEVARQAARIRNEKLVVIPSRTPEQEKILLKMHELDNQMIRVRAGSYDAYRTMDSYRVQLAKVQASKNPDPAQIEKLTSLISTWAQKSAEADQKVAGAVRALEEKKRALGNKVWVTKRELDAVIDGYGKRKEKISAIILSGHHDFKAYSGDLGSIYKTDITSALKKYPDLMMGVKTIYGWGCYSATLAEKDWWVDELKGVQLIGGFDAGAPASGRQASLQYLKGILVKEAQVLKVAEDRKTAHDVGTLSKMVRSIPGFTVANSAVCTREVSVSTVSGSMDLSKQAALCNKKHLDELKDGARQMESVAGFGGPGARAKINGDIPCNTQASWLRSHYTQARKHAHCGKQLGMLQAEFQEYTQHADSFIRLIDFEEVYEHFNHYYRTDLAKLKALEGKCGFKVPPMDAAVKCAAPPSQNPSLKTVTRKELLAFIDQLDRNACAAAPSAEKGLTASAKRLWENFRKGDKAATPAEQQLITRMKQRFDAILGRLDCIPLSWLLSIAPGKPIDPPSGSCNL